MAKPKFYDPESTQHKGLWDLAQDELLTVRDLLRFGVSRFNEAKLFFGHGSTNAYDEAVYLLLHTLHLPIDQLDPWLDARVLESERDLVLSIFKRRVKERLPAAYLTNEAWLGEHKFYVDKRVIVPRSYIAELLRDDLQPWIQDAESVDSVLDLCTGSGCLAILAALSFPNAVVEAVDLSPDALDVARRNIQDYRLESRVKLIESDMNKALKNRKYDLIISNPPYVTEESMGALPDEYRHEPMMALASGEDGLDHVRVILENAPKHLKDDGVLIVEVGHNREGVEAAFPDIPFVWPETSAGDGVVFLLNKAEIEERMGSA
jgi:ribosomal protein L3 glutamine methyltransferase